MSLSTEDPVAVAVVAAIRAGDVAALRRLLAEHEWLSTSRLGDDGPDAMSRTLLHVATDWPGHFPRVAETVRVLVEAGADVDARFVGPHEETPLHWAASSNDVEALEALLDAGADIEAPGAVLGGGPPLADARGFKNWDAASALVGRGAHVTLDDAATLGLMDRVEALFASDPPPTNDEVTRAFWGACHGGRAEVAALLLERGADLDWVPPWEHLTPLDAAEREGATELVAWLRARGARSAADLDTEPAGSTGSTEDIGTADKPSTVAYVQGVHLQRTDENVREIAALAAILGEPAGLDGLLDDLKYQARRSRIPARLLGRAVSDAYTWDAHDRRDPLWYPQGISTSADASDTEDIAGRKVLVTTWYSTGRDGVKRGSRVTFLDLETLRYRHVLLVNPVLDKEGNLQLRPMNIHAGGIVWAGPYLHVAATRRGFVTARVDDIMRVLGDDDHPDELGVDGQRVSSYGHRYVLPVRFTYKAFTDDGHEQLRYSFVSLDRRSDPPALVAGEYNRGTAPNRLARYQLDPATWQLATGEDGFSRPLEVDEGGVVQMQGAALAAGRYHVTVSHGPWMPGSVYAGTSGRLERKRFALPMGPEDLTYWPSTDRLWSLTEHPRRRWIVSMRRSAFD